MKSLFVLCITFCSLLVQGQAWTLVHSQQRELKGSFKDVKALSYKEGICVGDYGMIARYTLNDDKIKVFYEFSGTSDNLNSLSFPNSNIGYAGGPFGYILKTIDGGHSWSRIKTVDKLLPVSLAFTSPTHGVIISWDGEVVLTDDGGSTWTKVFQNGNYYFSKVYFLNEKKGFIVGDQTFPKVGGSKILILMTEDGGRSWRPAIKENGISMFTSTEEAKRVYRNVTDSSFDVGVEMRTRSEYHSKKYSQADYTGKLKDICFKNEREGAAVGNGCIVRTLDGGKTWLYYNQGIAFRAYLGITFSNDGALFTVGEKNNQALLVKGRVEYKYWQDANQLERKKLNALAAIGYDKVVAVGDEGSVVLINNEPAEQYAWKDPVENLDPNDSYLFPISLFGVKFVDARTGYAMGTYKDLEESLTAFFTTRDGGLNWNLDITNKSVSMRGLDISADLAIAAGWQGKLPATPLGEKGYSATSLGHLTFSTFTLPASLDKTDFWDVRYDKNKRTWYVVGSNGTFMRLSEISDSAWRIKNLGTDQPLTNICITSAGVIFISSNNGLLFRSEDGGETFTTCVTNTTEKLRGIAFNDGNNGIVVGDHGITLRTNDGGLTWEKKMIWRDAFLSSVAFRNKTDGFIVGEKGTIIETKDGGKHWTLKDSPVKDWLNRVYFYDENNGYIVGDNGVILKFNTGN